MSQAIQDIAAERQRQVEVEGWTPEHDDNHDEGDLALAAACYAAGEEVRSISTGFALWPWHADWWKPGTDRRRQLVKAGALIVAEIERIDRMPLPAAPGWEVIKDFGRNPATHEPSPVARSRPSGWWRLRCQLRGHAGMTIIGHTRSWLLMRCKRCGEVIKG